MNHSSPEIVNGALKTREVFLGKMMALISLLFIISHIPVVSILLFILITTANRTGNSVETSTFFWCLFFQHLNAALSPLLVVIEPHWAKRTSVKVLIASWITPMHVVDHETAVRVAAIEKHVKRLVLNNSPVLATKNSQRRSQQLTEGVLRPEFV